MTPLQPGETRTTRRRSRRPLAAAVALGAATALAASLPAASATGHAAGSGAGSPAGAAVAAGSDDRAEARDSERTQLVEPVLRRHLDLSGFADPGDFYRLQLAFGDLDGRGRHPDIVRYTNSRMQAFRYRGGNRVQLLWEWEAPVDLPPPPNRYHYKVTIWDSDADGAAEVHGVFPTAAGTLELRVLDGRTGTVEHAVDTGIPNPVSDDAVDEWRVDVVVADVRGLGRGRDIVLNTEFDSFGDLYVFDDELAPLWDTTGDNSPESGGPADPGGPGGKDRIYAHYPQYGDVDGDGRDEFAGTWLLDDDGSRVYRITPPEWEPEDFFYDHLDRAFIGDLDPRRPGAEVLGSYEFSQGFLLEGATGEPYWDVFTGQDDEKIAAFGEFLPDVPGLDVLTYDPADELRLQVLDLDGVNRGGIDIVRDGVDGYPVDWDGDRRVDELFEPRAATLMAPAENRTVVLQDEYETDRLTPFADGHRIQASMTDLVGDGREEIVIPDEDEILVYGAAGRSRAPWWTAPWRSPWRDPVYAYAQANTQNDNHPERRWFDWREIGRSAEPGSGREGRP